MSGTNVIPNEIVFASASSEHGEFIAEIQFNIKHFSHFCNWEILLSTFFLALFDDSPLDLDAHVCNCNIYLYRDTCYMLVPLSTNWPLFDMCSREILCTTRRVRGYCANINVEKHTTAHPSLLQNHRELWKNEFASVDLYINTTYNSHFCFIDAGVNYIDHGF